MPRFEVFAPAAAGGRPAGLVFRVDGESWLSALGSALRKIGEEPARNVLCDVRPDGSIHVRDGGSGRIFQIRELAPGASEPPGAPDARGSGPPPEAEPAREEVLAELFVRVGDLERRRERKAGLTFLLDLAVSRIGCEAGSAFTAHLSGGVLEFAVARGPRASELLRLGLTVPMGTGIVGFCAKENVCVAVSDAERDPRFHRSISLLVGYDTRSILCAPMASEGRVLGALEVLNKRGGRPFDATDVAVISYLAHKGAEHLLRCEGG